jgi:hypothetical protein
MPDQRQQKRLDRISKTNPERAKKVEQRMNNREDRYLSGGKSKLKHNRPDTPLATSPDTGDFSLKKEIEKRRAVAAAEKANEAYREKSMKELRDKKSQMSPEEIKQAAQR